MQCREKSRCCRPFLGEGSRAGAQLQLDHQHTNKSSRDQVPQPLAVCQGLWRAFDQTLAGCQLNSPQQQRFGWPDSTFTRKTLSSYIRSRRHYLYSMRGSWSDISWLSTTLEAIQLNIVQFIQQRLGLSDSTFIRRALSNYSISRLH